MTYIETNGFKLAKKKREWVSILLAIITIISLLTTIYYSQRTVELQKQNQDLQNSLYNYRPFLYVNNSVESNFNTISYNQDDNDGDAVFVGSVDIDLKIISPYDGLVTIKAKAFNYTYLNDTGSPTSHFLNEKYLNSMYVVDLSSRIHQYFVYKDVPNSIEDKITCVIEVYLKPHLFEPNVTRIDFPLGDIVFEASLFEVRTNQTIALPSFNERIWVDLVPVSP